MEVPEWAWCVSYGTTEDFEKFLEANPGFNFDGNTFTDCNAFYYAMQYNTFPLAMVELLITRGKMDVNRVCRPRFTPLEWAIRCDNPWLTRLLVTHGAVLRNSKVLLADDKEELRDIILNESTALEKSIVVDALLRLQDLPVRSVRWVSKRHALMSWCTSHDYRRNGAACAAWVLRELLPGQWPDMCEMVARILMETKVMDW
jgi:hypothetical protein